MSGQLVALTGATGFIGRHLLKELPKRGYKVRVLLRRPTMLPPEATGAVVGDLAAPRNMSNALAGVQAVIHSAGLAHGMSGLPEDDYRTINTEATVALARAAARAGAKRFVFLSSVRAQSGPTARQILTEALDPQPTDAYGRSKLDAERGLADTDIDWAALRPVLVFGPGVKGNMAALLKLAQLALPLPLGGLSGRRSLLAVDNLVEAVDIVLRADGPLRRPFIVADPEPLTIPEMIAALRAGLGRRPGLIPIPQVLLRHAMHLAGRGEAFERLAGSLVANPQALTELGWRPAVATRDALAALARDHALRGEEPDPSTAARGTA
jgi:nucleoside-diphosphate-sugar epimerase